MKLVLFSVSYAGLWGQEILPLEEFIPRAHKLGYQGIEIMGKRPHAFPADVGGERLNTLRKLLKENRLEVFCVAAYTNFTAGAYSREVPLFDVQVDYVGQLARMTKELGGDLVRVFTGYDVRGENIVELWNQCVRGIRACCDVAARFGVRIGIQNHHDIAVETGSLLEMAKEIDRKNVCIMFDAWSPFLRGEDLAVSAQKMAPVMAYTTCADYVKIPRYRYLPSFVNYERILPDMVKAVPMGEGCIDYKSFFASLVKNGYKGPVCYEMCSPLRGGGSLENMDRCAKQFIEYMQTLDF